MCVQVQEVPARGHSGTLTSSRFSKPCGHPYRSRSAWGFLLPPETKTRRAPGPVAQVGDLVRPAVKGPPGQPPSGSSMKQASSTTESGCSRDPRKAWSSSPDGESQPSLEEIYANYGSSSSGHTLIQRPHPHPAATPSRQQTALQTLQRQVHTLSTFCSLLLTDASPSSLDVPPPAYIMPSLMCATLHELTTPQRNLQCGIR